MLTLHINVTALRAHESCSLSEHRDCLQYHALHQLVDCFISAFAAGSVGHQNDRGQQFCYAAAAGCCMMASC